MERYAVASCMYFLMIISLLFQVNLYKLELHFTVLTKCLQGSILNNYLLYLGFLIPGTDYRQSSGCPNQGRRSTWVGDYHGRD